MTVEIPVTSRPREFAAEMERNIRRRPQTAGPTFEGPAEQSGLLVTECDSRGTPGCLARASQEAPRGHEGRNMDGRENAGPARVANPTPLAPVHMQAWRAAGRASICGYVDEFTLLNFGLYAIDAIPTWAVVRHSPSRESSRNPLCKREVCGKRCGGGLPE